MRNRSRVVILLLALGAAPVVSQAQDPILDRHRRMFEARVLNYEQEMGQIANRMLADYERARLQAVQTKDLAAANHATERIRMIKQQGWPVVRGDDPVLARHTNHLQSVQAAFRGEVAKVWRAVCAEYDRERDRALSFGQLDQANKWSARKARLTVDGALQKEVFREVLLADVSVRSSTAARVATLTAGARRLSNMGDAKIGRTKLRDAVFTIVGWRTTPTYQVSVKSSGLLYVMCVSDPAGNLKEQASDWPKAGGVISARWIHNVFARFVHAGESYTVGGYECSVVANTIELEP